MSEQGKEAIVWERFQADVRLLGHMLDGTPPARHMKVWGVPTGGSWAARMLAWYGWVQLLEPEDGCLVVDDLIDGGGTLRAVREWIKGRGLHCHYAAVYRKDRPENKDMAWASHALDKPGDAWLAFPWEGRDWRPAADGPLDAVVRLLQWAGEDPSRPGLAETPARVCKAFREMTAGYRQDPAEILSRVFDSSEEGGRPWQEMVVLSGIRFTSLCEHHLLPFTGTAAVGYLPGSAGKIVGISKLARLVECYARRLQVQERMAAQVADAVEHHLGAAGAGVVLRASHGCMSCRGVLQPTAAMTTSALRGLFKDDPATRAEFLRLALPG